MPDAPFILEFDAETGRAEELAPGLRRILAPNASPMTFRGTNTYLLGEAEIAVIDPGPDDPAHLQAILSSVGDARKISHILVTHSHLDHSPLAAALARQCDAPVLALGDSFELRSERMSELAALGDLGGGEGADASFRPDIQLADGTGVTSREWRLDVIATPGHFSNHACFAWRDRVFSGDHVMSWATTLVSPPDGDLTAFMHSLARLQTRDDRLYYPGHGAPLPEPARMLTHLAEHRKSREGQILTALEAGPAAALELARVIYTDIDPRLIPAAARNVFAHLLDLEATGHIIAEGPLTATARFAFATAHFGGK